MTRFSPPTGGSGTELLYSGSVGGGDAWTTSYQAMPTQRQRHAGFVIDGLIYMVDGYNGTNTISNVERYDPSADSWTTGLATPGTELQNHVAWSYDGFGYVAGGTDDGGTELDEVRRYDPSADSWSVVATAPATRTNGSTVVDETNGLAYWVGGDSNNSQADLWIYDMADDTFTTDNPPGSQLAEPGLGLYSGYLYAMGGSASGSSGWRYDIGAGTWTSITGYDKYNGNAAVVGNTIIHVGFDTTTFRFDMTTESITSSDNIPGVRAAVPVVASGGNVWLIGGRDGASTANQVWRYAPPQAPPVDLDQPRLVALRDAPSGTAELQNTATGQTGKIVAGAAGDSIDVTEAGNAEIYGV